jgi:hypothetical protein
MRQLPRSRHRKPAVIGNSASVWLSLLGERGYAARAALRVSILSHERGVEMRQRLLSGGVGTPAANAGEPVEVLRVVHSYDPCLACAVHVRRPGKDTAASRLSPACC